MDKKDNGYVENTQTEALASANTGAEGQKSCPNTASTAIGKFKDVDALMKAYDCLQAEFTRRSQRLKQLEREAENFKAKGGSAAVVEKLRENAEKAKSEEKEFDGFVADLERANVRARLDGALNDEESAKEAMEERETQAVQKDMQTSAEVPFGSSADVNSVREVESMAVEKEVEDKASLSGETSVAKRREVQPTTSDELYRMVSEDERVRLKIIGEYLQTLGKSGAPLAKGGNGVLSTPPMKAKTLREAGEMALRWFRREGVEA